mgnify:CR=1 FL=1
MIRLPDSFPALPEFPAGEVWLTGCFNADADSPLVWDASFTTPASKTLWNGLPQYQGNPNLIFRSRAGGNAS